MAFDYGSPGVAASDALEMLLAERALNKMKQNVERRAQEQHEAELEQQKYDREMRKQELDMRKQEYDSRRADKVQENLMPGDIPDADTAALLQRSGRGGSLRIVPGGVVVGPQPSGA